MAWSFIAASTPVSSASGNLVLTEPAGAAAGHLLTAVIAYRGATALTLPAGWALVATQQSAGNTTAFNTASTSSILMAYIVRGASAPDLTFTRTGGSLAQGAVTAYSGGAATPYDTGNSDTLAVASTSVTLAGITTTEAGELIVIGGSGARSGTFSAWAATDPASLTERVDANVATSPSVGLGISDAVRTTAGATGTLRYTQSSSAQHAIVAGAFKVAAVSIAGTAAITLNALTAAATANLPIGATGTVTLGSLGALGAASLAISATEVSTLGPLTGAGAATLSIRGSGAILLGGLTAGSAGALPIVSGAAIMLGAVELAAAGKLPIEGQASVTLGALAALASGSLANIPIVGAGQSMLGLIVAGGTGRLAVTGALDGLLGALTLVATGSAPRVPPAARTAVVIREARMLSIVAAPRIATVNAEPCTVTVRI